SLVREYLAGQLRDIPGRYNDPLLGGVTIAALQPQRAIPFSIIYVLGMGDQLFPGDPFVSPLDLRQARRCAGDILPVEQMRSALPGTILATRSQPYLTFVQRDLQKDQELQPAVAVLQLVRYLDRHVLAAPPFSMARVPLVGHDEKYLAPIDEDAPHDVLVQYRP